jgi:hypothetical protein
MKLTQAQLQRIRALESKAGRLSARRLLVDAKDRRSPLHSLFNWNLRQVAEKAWLHRAREIIGAVRIQVVHSLGLEPEIDALLLQVASIQRVIEKKRAA